MAEFIEVVTEEAAITTINIDAILSLVIRPDKRVALWFGGPTYYTVTGDSAVILLRAIDRKRIKALEKL